MRAEYQTSAQQTSRRRLQNVAFLWSHGTHVYSKKSLPKHCLPVLNWICLNGGPWALKNWTVWRRWSTFFGLIAVDADISDILLPLGKTFSMSEININSKTEKLTPESDEGKKNKRTQKGKYILHKRWNTLWIILINTAWTFFQSCLKVFREHPHETHHSSGCRVKTVFVLPTRHLEVNPYKDYRQYTACTLYTFTSYL